MSFCGALNSTNKRIIEGKVIDLPLCMTNAVVFKSLYPNVRTNVCPDVRSDVCLYEDIPDDIILDIGEYLHFRDLYSFMLACKRNRHVLEPLLKRNEKERKKELREEYETLERLNREMDYRNEFEIYTCNISTIAAIEEDTLPIFSGYMKELAEGYKRREIDNLKIAHIFYHREAMRIYTKGVLIPTFLREAFRNYFTELCKRVNPNASCFCNDECIVFYDPKWKCLPQPSRVLRSFIVKKGFFEYMG